jgi:hypothetical protein
MLLSSLLAIIIIMKSSVGRYHYVTLQKAGFAITLHNYIIISHLAELLSLAINK